MDWHCELEHGKEICLRESKMGVYLPGIKSWYWYAFIQASDCLNSLIK